MSSNILSRRVDVEKFGVIFAGAQKNIGCAGVTVVIVRRDLLSTRSAHPLCPLLLSYAVQSSKGSMYNTPPTWSIFVAGLVFSWLRDEGGVDAIAQRNSSKATLLYDF